MQVIDVDSHPDTRHTLEIHCGNSVRVSSLSMGP
jgi:hypothetical protein